MNSMKNKLAAGLAVAALVLCLSPVKADESYTIPKGKGPIYYCAEWPEQPCLPPLPISN